MGWVQLHLDFYLLDGNQMAAHPKLGAAEIGINWDLIEVKVLNLDGFKVKNPNQSVSTG